MQYPIVIKNLSKSYRTKETTKKALSNVTFNIPQGEIFVSWVRLAAVRVHC